MRPYENLQGLLLETWAKKNMTPGEYAEWEKVGKPPIISCKNYIATNADDYAAMEAYCKKGCKK